MEGATRILNNLLQVLPTSPFQSFISNFTDVPFLGFLNYFIPITQMIAIGEAWLVAIALYYIYVIALRWIKAIN